MEIKDEAIIEHLNSGGVLAYPTETIWGLGSLIYNEESLKKIFKIKNRNYDMALSVLVRDINMAESLAHLSRKVEKLLMIYWPGPLTVVCPAKESVHELIHGGTHCVGLRCSSHPFLKKFMIQLNQPLITTSANYSGESPAASLAELDWLPDEVMKVSWEKREERGESLKGSTVVKLTPDEKLEVLREGDLPLDSLFMSARSIGFKL